MFGDYRVDLILTEQVPEFSLFLRSAQCRSHIDEVAILFVVVAVEGKLIASDFTRDINAYLAPKLACGSASRVETLARRLEEGRHIFSQIPQAASYR
jgi:hypothetical protein